MNGVAFACMEEMLKPYAKKFQRKDDPYSLRSNVLSTQQSEATAVANVTVGAGDATLPDMLYTQMT